MSRLEKKEQAHLSVHNINSPETFRALRIFSNLLKACAGPCGKNHVVRNNCGGHVTVTGSCTRLLSVMSITRPELKLISASVQAHLQRCGDAGLFMTQMCSSLILLSSDIGFSSHTLRHLFDTFLNIINSHLSETCCKVIVDVSFDKLDYLVAYVRSILSSKSLLNLCESDCEALSRHVVKVFLESIPSEGDTCGYKSDRVHFMTIENRPISYSCVESGLLLLYPECPVVKGSRVMQLKTHPMNAETANRLKVPEVSTFIKVAMFTCSMSGDLDELIEAHFEVTTSQEQAVEASVVVKMLGLCEALHSLGVGLLLCQKVIHPKVKAALRSKDICFVDRLGAHIVPYLQDMTGAQPMTSVVDWTDMDSCLGWVTSAVCRVEFQQSYLHLSRPDSSVMTFVLCNQWEEKLSETKICVKSALKGLSALLRERKLLMGGGCWQVYVSHILKHKVLEQLDLLSNTMACSKRQILKTLAVFRASLQSWALSLVEETDNLVVDPCSYHVWRVPKGKEETISADRSMPCQCGLKATLCHNLSTFQYVSVEELVSTSDVFGTCDDRVNTVEDKDFHVCAVLDNYLAGTSALKQAVATANLVLSVGQFIVDKN